MTQLGRALLVAGVVIALLGGVLLLAGRIGIPLGRLPGDISYRGRNVQIFFPIATCILLSIIFTLVAYLISHFRR